MKCWRNNLTNLKSETSSPSLEPFLAPSSEHVIPDFDLDVDVAAERNRVLSGSIDNAIIYLSNLRKVPSFFILFMVEFLLEYFYLDPWFFVQSCNDVLFLIRFMKILFVNLKS